MIRSFISNATKFRRTTAGLCLILAPLFLLISNLLQTRAPMSTQALLDAITARAAANELSFAFALYGFTLMAPATIGIVHLLRHRSVALGHIGGTLPIVGMVSFAFVAGTEAILYIAGEGSAAPVPQPVGRWHHRPYHADEFLRWGDPR